MDLFKVVKKSRHFSHDALTNKIFSDYTRRRLITNCSTDIRCRYVQSVSRRLTHTSPRFLAVGSSMYDLTESNRPDPTGSRWLALPVQSTAAVVGRLSGEGSLATRPALVSVTGRPPRPAAGRASKIAPSRSYLCDARQSITRRRSSTDCGSCSASNGKHAGRVTALRFLVVLRPHNTTSDGLLLMFIYNEIFIYFDIITPPPAGRGSEVLYERVCLSVVSRTTCTDVKNYMCTLYVYMVLARSSTGGVTLCYLVSVLYVILHLLGPFHGAIAVPSVTRCRCRCRRCRHCRCRGHRCAGGARQYR